MTAARVERFDVGDAAIVDVRCATGRVRVVPGPPGAVEVRLAGPGADSLRVERHGDRITVRTPSLRPGRWSDTDVDVAAAEGMSLEVKGAALDVDATVALGRLRADLATGEVHIERVGGDATIRTASGDIELGTVEGRVEVTSASGDCRVQRLSGPATVTSASGDVWVGWAGDSLSCRSASGDVDVGCYAGDALSCTTMSGDVRVVLPSGRTVDLDLSSLSGDVRHDFAPGERSASRVKVTVRTVSGDIRLTSAA